jgi:hypothetical protein
MMIAFYIIIGLFAGSLLGVILFKAQQKQHDEANWSM